MSNTGAVIKHEDYKKIEHKCHHTCYKKWLYTCRYTSHCGCVCRMAVDGGHIGSGSDWNGRWNHVKKFLERTGPFTHPDFEPSTEVMHKYVYKMMHTYYENILLFIYF